MTPTQPTITTKLDATDRVSSAMARAATAFREFTAAVADTFVPVLQAAGKGIARLMASITELANDPVHVTGMEARYYVRAGLDPAYADPTDLDALVRSICSGAEDELFAMTPANRLVVATAAMRGWATHRADHNPVLAWHWQMAGTRIVVTRSVA